LLAITDTSVALNLFEPRFCLMAKQILDKESGEKVFGYMETVPPVGADGQDDFTGMTGRMCTVGHFFAQFLSQSLLSFSHTHFPHISLFLSFAQVVWWRWLEKQGPGGRVAIDIVEGPVSRAASLL